MSRAAFVRFLVGLLALFALYVFSPPHGDWAVLHDALLPALGVYVWCYGTAARRRTMVSERERLTKG